MEKDEILILLENQLVVEAKMRKKREHLVELHAQEKILQQLRHRIHESIRSGGSENAPENSREKFSLTTSSKEFSLSSLSLSSFDSKIVKELNGLLVEVQQKISDCLQWFETQPLDENEGTSGSSSIFPSSAGTNSPSIRVRPPSNHFSPFSTRFKGKVYLETELDSTKEGSENSSVVSMEEENSSKEEWEPNQSAQHHYHLQQQNYNHVNPLTQSAPALVALKEREKRELPPNPDLPEIQISFGEFDKDTLKPEEEQHSQTSPSGKEKGPPPAVPPRSKFGTLKMKLANGLNFNKDEKEGTPKSPRSERKLRASIDTETTSAKRPVLTSALSVPVLASPKPRGARSNNPSPRHSIEDPSEYDEKERNNKLTLSGTLTNALNAFKGSTTESKRERSRSFNSHSPSSSPSLRSSKDSTAAPTPTSSKGVFEKKPTGRSRGASFDDDQGPAPIAEPLSNKTLSQRQIRLVRGVLYIQINSASNLYCKSGNTVNPYYMITFNGKSHRSKVLKNILNPEWPDEIFQYNVDPSSPSQLFVDVFNHHKFSANKRLGRAVISILDLLEENEFDRYIPLSPIKDSDNVSGGLNVSVKFSPDTIGDSTESKSEYQVQVLFSAIQNSDIGSLDRLLNEKIDPNSKDKYGFSLLHAACIVYSEHDEDILMRILNLNGLQIDIVNNDKNTALHYFAAYFRNPNLSRPFATFVKKGANLNAKNNYGETPLHKALLNNSVRTLIVDLLLNAGANANAVNNLSESVLYYAVKNQSGVEVVRNLLRQGADYTIRDSKLNLSPLDLAIQQGDQQVKYILQRTESMCDWLDQIGMDRYKKNFLKEDISLDILCGADSIDLELDLGIVILPHQVMIKKAIAKLKDEKRASATLELSSLRLDSPPVSEGEFVFSLTAPPGFETGMDTDFSSGRSVKNSSSFTMDGKTEEEINDHWQKELDKLEYIKDHGSWVLNSSDIEYTVKLGEGSFGDVFKGLYKGKQEVAVKVLRKKPELLEEFKKEFQINCTLRSPYVVYFLGICLGAKTCIVMEYCSHGSLYSVLKDNSLTFTWESFFKASREILLGLHYLHSHDPQILHRDMKTPNLMVTSDFTVKMADFGTSRFNITSEQNTLIQVRGSKAYTAPELFFGQTFTVKSDIFSVSIILWEMAMRILKGSWVAPYSEFNQLRHDYQIYYQVSKMELRNNIPKHCPPSVSSLITRCWDADPNVRPDSQETLDLLADIQKDWKKNQKSWDKLTEKTK